MTTKVTLVSSPDDVYFDAYRILAVDLNTEQSKTLSDTLLHLNNIPDTVIYVWQNTDNLEWLFDKKHKSDIILFNADSERQSLAGYFSAQVNSYYFGFLKDLDIINNKAIYSVDDLSVILGDIFETKTRQ